MNGSKNKTNTNRDDVLDWLSAFWFVALSGARDLGILLAMGPDWASRSASTAPAPASTSCREPPRPPISWAFPGLILKTTARPTAREPVQDVSASGWPQLRGTSGKRASPWNGVSAFANCGRAVRFMPISGVDRTSSAVGVGAAFEAPADKVRFGRAASDGPAGCGAWPPVRGAAGPVFCGLSLATHCTASAVACP